jgi:hypothetical protein
VLGIAATCASVGMIVGLTTLRGLAPRFAGGGELLVPQGTLWCVTRQDRFHFGWLVSIIGLLLIGFLPVWAAFLGDAAGDRDLSGRLAGKLARA